MTGVTNQERARQRAIASFKRLGDLKDAAIESRVPISSLREWLQAEGIPVPEVIHRERVKPSRQPETRTPRHDINRLVFVDRDPCPRCGTRKDVGCKHFANAAAALPTARDIAEREWKGLV